MKHKLKSKLLLLAIICMTHAAYNQVQIGNDIIGEGYGSFFSTDLSSDGSILAIGRHAGDSIVGQSSVYKLDNNDWQLMGKTIENGKNVTSSECSVNLSANGNRLVTGIPYYTRPDSLRYGLVRVYEFVDDDWTQIGQDLSGSLNGEFGIKVLISEDGNRIVVLERNYRPNSTEFGGRVQVFDIVDDEWIQVGSDIVSSEFIWDVAFSTDGNQLVFYGSVTMLFYSLSNTNEWEEQATFLEPKGSARGLSFSNDGTSLISFDRSNPRRELQVYSNENGWGPKGSRIAIDSVWHSQAVFLNSDGSKIAMTAYNVIKDTITNTIVTVNNYCYIYEYINNDWEQNFLFKSTENELLTRDIISVSDNGVIAVAYGLSGKSLVKVFDLSDFISSNSYITEEESPLYPNPTYGILYIQENSNTNEVTIYDPSGRLIRSQLIKNGEIDITDLNSGTYFLQVGTNIQRIIKE